MGLRAASTSVPSSSASENVSPIHQKGFDVDEEVSVNLKENNEKLRHHLNTVHLNLEDKRITSGIIVKIDYEKDSKLLSNASARSNMAPALTEPLSPANKLSSSTTSASPRPTSNSQLAVNSNNYLLSSTTINGDTNNLIDIESELLRVAEGSLVNGSSSTTKSTKTKTTSGIYASNNILKENGVASQKGAFQLAFEQVVAKQTAAVAAVASSTITTSSKQINSNLKKINKTSGGGVLKTRLNISREKFSRQMGPMCDTNNLTKSQLLRNSKQDSSDTQHQQTLLESNSGVVQQEKIEEVEASEHMDLSTYDNEDSQQENAQTEINSSSSTVTAENTDVEDNVQFSDDVNTIVINNEEIHRPQATIAQGIYEKLQRTPPRTVTSNTTTISTSQFLEQQQQSQNQNQMITTTPVCSLTPQSTTSAGGLSLQKDFIKDSVEMDQVLGDMDLLQVLKGFDSAPGGENLCDLAGSLGLFNDVDVMNYEEMGTPIKDSETREIRNEIERRQQQMQRKCDFLLRRLRKIQARYMGRHASEEVAGLFEWTNRIVRRKDREHNSRQILYEEDKRRPVSTASMRSFLKRLDAVATSQHSNQSKSSKTSMLGAGGHIGLSTSSTGVSSGGGVMAGKLEMSPVISAYDEKTTEDIGHISGMLQTEMKEVQSGIDSDVTASSSGGESADEMVTYNNQIQQSLSIAKRAAWRWARDRAAIAARWTWLLAQISDLEYRIRQHNELHHQIKKNKGAVTFEKVTASLLSSSSSSLDHHQQQQQQEQQQQSSLPSSVNGYRGTLPGCSKMLDIDRNSPPNGAYETNNLPGACRTRPFQRTGFRKRKLLQTANVHTISKKAARSSTIKCGCQWPLHPCALCTGRSDPTAPRDLPDTMTFSERVALLDPGFHAVLSFPEDISNSIHFEAIMRLPDWQNRVMRSPSKTILKGGAVSGTAAQQKAAERGEDRSTSSSKKLMDSRRKQNRKYTQDSGPAANKLKNAKARRTLHGGSQFNNSHHHHPHVKNSSSKHRKLSSAGGISGSMGAVTDYQEGMSGSTGTNSSSGVTGSSDGGIDGGNDYGNNGSGNGHHISRSKNSSPTPGNHSTYNYKSESSSRFDRKNRNSYDIDNIVIPYSVAATTRVEILPYKEIPTPKWRIVEEDDDSEEQNKVDSESSVTEGRDGDNEEYEDISDLAIQIRHERALLEERKKFQTYLKFPWSTRSRANRRIDSRAESSGANTPDPTSPASNTPNIVGDHESIPSPANPSTPQTPAESVEGGENTSLQNPITTFLNSTHRRGERRRTVSSKKDPGKEEQRRSSSPDGRDMIPPFEPFEFPLSDEKYESMLKMMPNNHHLLTEDCSKTNCDQDVIMHDSKAAGAENEGDREGSTGLSTATTITTAKLKTNSDDLLSAFDTGDSLMGCDSDTDSAESGLQDEDPNDPEWREPA